MEENNHIYPIFDRMLMRKDKEDLLKQHGVMIWFTGLSGSGKSTIAIALERELHKGDCFAVSWMVTTSAVASTVTSALRRPTVWRISGV